jgi:hypothetical protein
MLYTITRASLDYEDKPCDEAVLNQEQKWTVDFKSLEELQAFIVKYRRIVIDKNSIIIYDYYIE